MFVGTEFGLFFTQDGGDDWHQLKGNFPTIAVRDLEIQRRETDLVVGTFGRGIYILDDYSPLRSSIADVEGEDAQLFPVKDPWLYVEGDLWDGREKGSMGAEFFTAPNPAFGAVFTYHLGEELQTQRKTRRTAELEVEEEGGDTPYPSWDTLRQEDREEDPSILLVVKDSSGNVIRQVKGETGEGLHRTAWDLRWPAPQPVVLEKPDFVPYWESPPRGPFVVPGEYSVTLAKRQGGQLVELGGPQTFTVKPLMLSPEISDDPASVRAFQRKAGELFRAVQGAVAHSAELTNRITHLKAAIRDTPDATEAEEQALREIEAQLANINVALQGDTTVSGRNEPTAWSVSQRAGIVYQRLLDTRSPVPGLYEESYAIAASEFETVLSDLRVASQNLSELEQRLEGMGAPWTPGRQPSWGGD